ncbi:hypothetical protein [Ensifer aridi]|uniref:hypothetical protein n=1 Tax=Ensifer aridi TaxID=1708715 RepID=UPI000A11272E|nr:hypothetical protein [Ensifer aridi]
MTTITLTITVTEAERESLIKRFIETANAVTGEIDDEGTPGDPNGDKRDATGVVWDARYHGANMSKNQDGTWRRKKGLSDQEKADADAYEAGCRGAPTAVAQAAAGVAAPVAAAPVAPQADVPQFLQTGTFTPAPAAPVAAPVMAMPGIPAAPVAPPAPPPAPSYEELIAAFQTTIGRVGQRVVDANLAAIYTNAGVTDMNQLVENPEIRRAVKAGLDALQPA